jgi:hypothetical protein
VVRNGTPRPHYREPDWSKLHAFPGLKLHLYGKHHARPGRKMGHFTVLDGDPERARQGRDGRARRDRHRRMRPEAPHSRTNDRSARCAAAAGELVAFPTETVYGLGADAANPAAVARIFAAKGGRPTTR